MTELLFIVTEDSGGGLNARAVGPTIFTQAGTDVELEGNVREAVRTHYSRIDDRPRVLHLHYVRDRTISLTDDRGQPSSARDALRGSVLGYDDPFAPACPPEDWEANR